MFMHAKVQFPPSSYSSPTENSGPFRGFQGGEQHTSSLGCCQWGAKGTRRRSTKSEPLKSPIRALELMEAKEAGVGPGDGDADVWDWGKDNKGDPRNAWRTPGRLFLNFRILCGTLNSCCLQTNPDSSNIWKVVRLQKHNPSYHSERKLRPALIHHFIQKGICSV